MMNGQDVQTQRVYDLNQQVTVTLTLQTWNVVLGFIAEGPWKTANPIIQEIQGKLNQALEPQTERRDTNASA